MQKERSNLELVIDTLNAQEEKRNLEKLLHIKDSSFTIQELRLAQRAIKVGTKQPVGLGLEHLMAIENSLGSIYLVTVTKYIDHSCLSIRIVGEVPIS